MRNISLHSFEAYRWHNNLPGVGAAYEIQIVCDQEVWNLDFFDPGCWDAAWEEISHLNLSSPLNSGEGFADAKRILKDYADYEEKKYWKR